MDNRDKFYFFSKVLLAILSTRAVYFVIQLLE